MNRALADPRAHSTAGNNDAARYAVGPSKAGLNGGASAPGVAETRGHQGVPTQATVAVGTGRAAEEAALHRIARRRQRKDIQRQERVDVRYSAEEKAQILTRARSLNIAGAHLVGAAVMAYLDGDLSLPGQRTAVDDLIDELAALRRQVAYIGNNVNQVAFRLNSGGAPRPVDTAVLGQAEKALETAQATAAAIDTASDKAVADRARAA
ncbi:plasmid mobilization relaxosome protein MobC [Streptomyces reniochalinae]|uniref:Plasmid mobilization relaxosome protein MobC n=1 Tax=Streptomyces reniochalinae TaxID=2250578 RepID=A0A367EBK3_9ACTN|nr:plasmid mobilization relaxosome protein MobC [Streptomyces reniochalinae]